MANSAEAPCMPHDLTKQMESYREKIAPLRGPLTNVRKDEEMSSRQAKAWFHTSR
ncbi:hypothetical protein BGZ98_000882, partial [Dissophora globulifera]